MGALMTIQLILYFLCLPPHLQAFIAPVRDLRYIASWGGEEGTVSACATFARRFSQRYTHAYDDGSVAPPVSYITHRLISSDDCFSSPIGNCALVQTIRCHPRALSLRWWHLGQLPMLPTPIDWILLPP